MTQPVSPYRRVYAWQAAFSVGAALVLGWTVPFLLQLHGRFQRGLALTLVCLAIVGASATLANTQRRMLKYTALVRAIEAFARGDESPPVEVDDLARFANEPSRLARRWLAFHALAMGLMLTPLRPSTLDLTTATAIVLLASLILATASLPMHVLVRHDFLDFIECAPPSAMKEVIQKLEKSSQSRGRINRKIVIAVTTPVLFVALGSALIVNAHLRRDDEKSREQSARALVQSLTEPAGARSAPGPGLAKAAELGFPTRLDPAPADHAVLIDTGGVTELTVPLDAGAAKVRFNASTVSIIGVAPVLVSLLATVAAAIVGFLLGNVLSMDLYYATRGVRLLGANPAALKSHTGVLRPPRLGLVAELAAAIDRLTGRFAVFAQAQEKAISARSTAVRARGLFFASVSHDLKAPLNSILGFTHLVGLQPLTKGQRESLDAIDTRAKELLALIETILDAARVEEGHLSLVTDEVPFQELHEQALAKARQLSSGFAPKVFEEIEENIPALLVDRMRVMRAVATLIAYSARTNEGGKMWIRAERESEKAMRIDIDVPRPAHSPTQLEWMLSPSQEHRQREHRGLALGLRLARSVVQLHGGTVRVIDRGKKGAMFCVKLPTVASPMPNASAPLHSIPPPPSSGQLAPPSLPSGFDPLPAPPRLPDTGSEPRTDYASSATPPSSRSPNFGPPSSGRIRTPTETTLDLDGIPPPPPLDSHPPPLFPSSRPPSSSHPPMTEPALPIGSHRELLPSETPLPPSSRPFHLPLPRVDGSERYSTPPKGSRWSAPPPPAEDSDPPESSPLSSDRPTPAR